MMKDTAKRAVDLVLLEVAVALRTQPEMVAPVIGLRYLGAWDGEHHYAARAEEQATA